MCELEYNVIPQLGEDIDSWTIYADDKFAFIKPDKIELIKWKLKEFDDNVKFTHDVEKKETIPFFDMIFWFQKLDHIKETINKKK